MPRPLPFVVCLMVTSAKPASADPRTKRKTRCLRFIVVLLQTRYSRGALERQRIYNRIGKRPSRIPRDFCSFPIGLKGKQIAEMTRNANVQGIRRAHKFQSCNRYGSFELREGSGSATGNRTRV